MLKITSMGIIVTSPNIFGRMMKLAELMPIISRASICWVTRMVPISDAMFEPTLPARMRHMILEENSSSMISRVVYPVVNAGIHGDAMFSFIWMHITAPMKKEISRTMPMLSTPRAAISLMYCLRNILHLSGNDITLPIRHRYSPNFVMLFLRNMLRCLFMGTKVRNLMDKGWCVLEKFCS